MASSVRSNRPHRTRFRLSSEATASDSLSVFTGGAPTLCTTSITPLKCGPTVPISGLGAAGFPVRESEQLERPETKGHGSCDTHQHNTTESTIAHSLRKHVFQKSNMLSAVLVILEWRSSSTVCSACRDTVSSDRDDCVPQIWRSTHSTRDTIATVLAVEAAGAVCTVCTPASGSCVPADHCQPQVKLKRKRRLA